MSRYVAYSKFDGQPLPARNRVEWEALLAEGHHRSQPTPVVDGRALVGETGPELVDLPEGHIAAKPDTSGMEVDDAAGPPDADVLDPAGDDGHERLRDEGGVEDVADGGDGEPLPPAAVRRNRGQRSS